MDSREQALAFLWFGFVPSCEVAQEESERLLQLRQDDRVPVFDWESAPSMQDLWQEIVAEQVQSIDQVVLPLSSGLDSRAILGALLECVDASQIASYTVGHPGTVDFDRAKSLFGRILPKHKLIDVREFSLSWSTERAIETVKKRKPGLILGIGEFGTSGLANLTVSTTSGSGVRINGFLGDTLSGKKLNGLSPKDWRQTVQKFISRNYAYKGSFALVPESFDPWRFMPASPLQEERILSYDDQLDWCFRQKQRVGNFFVPSSKRPFSDDRWWRSFMMVPRVERWQQRAYKRFLRASYPCIFPDLTQEVLDQTTRSERHPRYVATRLKRWRSRKKSASSHHVDMDTLLADDTSFRNFLTENILDLHASGLVDWIDLPGVLRSATQNPRGCGRPLYGLASLEINRKAGRLGS